MIEDESLGAAFAGGLEGLANKSRFANVAVTARLLPGGRLQGLNADIGPKLAAAKVASLDAVIVAPTNYAGPYRQINADRIRLHKAETVKEAVNYLTGLPDKFHDFLARLEKRFTRDFWHPRRPLETADDDLYLIRN